MSFMEWQAEFGSDYLKISAYITFGMFVIFGIIAFIAAFIPMKSSCVDDSDCSGDDNKCKGQYCDKTQHHYWLIGVAIGSIIFGFGIFWLMNQASHSKTLSQIAAFGAEANMVSDLINPNRFNSSKRRKRK